MTTNEKIAKVRALMQKNGVSACIVPSADPHMSEYFSDHWKTRRYLSGFTGSAGTYLITNEMAGLWTDGRYYVQAAAEIADSEATLFKAAEPDCPTVPKYLAENLPEKSVVGINGKLFSAATVKEMQKLFAKKEISIRNDVDYGNDVWEDRPAEELTPVYSLDVQYAGKAVAQKLEELRGKLKEVEADALVLNKLDCIAWLYNIRSRDVSMNPVVISYAFVSPTEAILFADDSRIPAEVRATLAENGVAIRPYDEVFSYVAKLDQKLAVLCDEKELNYSLYCAVEENPSLTAVSGTEPVQLLKACKNETETANTYKAYLKDGIAEAEFYGWLFEELEKGTALTEWTASEKLGECRAQQEHYSEDSFTTIMAYRENAAMMHYAPSAQHSKSLHASHFLLNDSGGQYLEGTTDTTRTFALGEITEEERRDYTLVLKAVIALSRVRFKKGMSGGQLDVLSRSVLWEHGLDYRCGTGHGVGYLLNVHEGPQSFGNKDIVLQEGMVLTIEPGIYTEGSRGIRIENTAVVVPDGETEYGKFYRFDTFTVVPIDATCLELSRLTDTEIEWLNRYNAHVRETLTPHLSARAKAWVEKMTQPVAR